MINKIFNRFVIGIAIVAVVFYAFTLLWYKHASTISKRFWDSQNKHAMGQLVYVALGDSVAQGIGASRPENSYVSIIAGRLHKQTGKSIKLINLSVSGANIDDLIRFQLPKVSKYKPDIITVDIGSNNLLWHTVDEKKFDTEYERLLQHLPSGAFVADIPNMGFFTAEKIASHSSELLTALSRQYSVMPVYVHSPTRVYCMKLDYYAPDLIHPGDKGHKVWADAFWDSIAKDRGYSL